MKCLNDIWICLVVSVCTYILSAIGFVLLINKYFRSDYVLLSGKKIYSGSMENIQSHSIAGYIDIRLWTHHCRLYIHSTMDPSLPVIYTFDYGPIIIGYIYITVSLASKCTPNYVDLSRQLRLSSNMT